MCQKLLQSWWGVLKGIIIKKKTQKPKYKNQPSRSHSVSTAGLAKSPKDPEEGVEGGSESRDYVFRFSSLRRWWDLCDLQDHYYICMSYKILMGLY